MGAVAPKNICIRSIHNGEDLHLKKTSTFACFITMTRLLRPTVRSLEKSEHFKTSRPVYAPHYPHIYVLLMFLAINSHYFFIPHAPTGSSNGSARCSLCSTN